MDPLAVGPAEAGRLMGGVPERTVYEEIAAGRLKSFKVGKRRLIRIVDIEAFLERRALLASGAPTTRRSTPARQPRRANDGPVVPFPQYEAGGKR